MAKPFQQAYGTLALTACLWTAAAAQETAPAPQRNDSALHTLTVLGQQRQYLLRLPAGQPTQAKGWPLVLVFHGGGGDALGAERVTGFSALGSQQGFAVLYPQGTAAAGQRLGTWNAQHCCGLAMRHGVDDTGFVAALLDELLQRHPIDERRIYATGLSNGGMLVHRLASTQPERWAAIAPVIAGLFGDEPTPAAPVPAFIVNGELDASIPLEGGAPAGRFRQAWSGRALLPVASQGRFWAQANACQQAAQQRVWPSHLHWQYHCPAGQDVEQVLVTGVGHAWPGGQRGAPGADDPGTRFDATAHIWRFFERHRRP